MRLIRYKRTGAVYSKRPLMQIVEGTKKPFKADNLTVALCFVISMDNTLIQIRLATIDDLLDIESCARDAYSKYIERIGRVPLPMVADFASHIGFGQALVALCESSFVGYVVFYPEGDHLQLENVAVVPAFEGQGIGKRLIEYVEQTACDIGLPAVELYTNIAMTENLSMYPKLGYVETERKQQAGFSRVFYRKPLSSAPN